MMEYAFKNHRARPQKIVEMLCTMYPLTAYQNAKNDYVLSNEDMIINVEKKMTSILLYNTGVNIKSICNFFREK